MIEKDIWLVGTGGMGIEYAKVLNALGCHFTAIGRGKKSTNDFTVATGHPAVEGGLKDFLKKNPRPADAAIVAVGIETLAETTAELLNHGIKYILLEKPGVGYADEIHDLVEMTKRHEATVLIGYNRRFYASVQKAKELIQQEGGVISCQFEFTEWSHIVSQLQKHPSEHLNWFLGNSTHVIDTAFFLAGTPVEMSSYVKGGLNWHPASSIFAGAGITNRDALFSYHANWEAPGRWALELLTRKNRYIFKPMEKLQVQTIGSIVVNPVPIEDQLDIDYKPGLFLQTKAFLDQNHSDFIDIFGQQEAIEKFYKKMSNYTR